MQTSTHTHPVRTCFTTSDQHPLEDKFTAESDDVAEGDSYFKYSELLFLHINMSEMVKI